MDGEGVNEPFDLVFVDTGKENNLNDLKYAMKFAKTGTLTTVDNVVRQGRLTDSENADPGVRGLGTFSNNGE